MLHVNLRKTIWKKTKTKNKTDNFLSKFWPGSDLCDFCSRLPLLTKVILLICSNIAMLYNSSWNMDSYLTVIFRLLSVISFEFCWAATIFIIFWDCLMFYQIFLSPKVKRCAIITYKHGIYEFPHELPNDLRLRILGN